MALLPVVPGRATAEQQLAVNALAQRADFDRFVRVKATSSEVEEAMYGNAAPRGPLMLMWIDKKGNVRVTRIAQSGKTLVEV